ncbi:MAG: DUF3276 family protein [Bacteroidetes bacterium]|nr:DUF3276 family protein [Bacteroidota bacterium]
MSSYENQDELYSRPVRAGKRTYFFDVKATRGKDLYMTITESKRRFDDHGNVSYSKHKIFLYREDFEKFEEGFLDAVDKIAELMESGEFRDPMAERAAQEQEQEQDSQEESAPAAESGAPSEDDIAFDDL